MWSLILLASTITGFLGAQFGNAADWEVPNYIVGGVEVSIEKAPYQLGLEEDGYFVCGASVIDKLWALTAAHCVWGAVPEQYKLRSGSSMMEKGGKLHRVTKFFIHEQYNKRTLDFDVAVLRVDIPFDKHRVIPLAKTQPAPGKMATVSGWGRVRENGPVSKKLLWAPVPIVSHMRCVLLYANLEFVVTEQMLCAGYVDGGKDACEGDSGGPLVFGDKLVGIVSQGNGCATKEPGIYTDVAALRTWIVKQMAKESRKRHKKRRH